MNTVTALRMTAGVGLSDKPGSSRKTRAARPCENYENPFFMHQGIQRDLLTFRHHAEVESFDPAEAAGAVALIGSSIRLELPVRAST